MVVVRPPGQGRKARAQRRKFFQQQQCSTTMPLHKVPWLHGNTRPGRLALLDFFMIHWINQVHPDGTNFRREPSHPMTRDQTFFLWAVDVGIGDSIDTTCEWARTLGDDWQVIGTECDPVRLERAQQQQVYENYHHYPPGGCGRKVDICYMNFNFQLPSIMGTTNEPHCIRMMNVLRDYDWMDACQSLFRLCHQLHDKGILFEGSTSPTGDTMVVLMINSNAYVVGVIFGVNGNNIIPDENKNEDNPYTCWPCRFERCLPRLWRGYCACSCDKANTTKPQNQHRQSVGLTSAKEINKLWKAWSEVPTTLTFLESIQQLQKEQHRQQQQPHQQLQQQQQQQQHDSKRLAGRIMTDLGSNGILFWDLIDDPVTIPVTIKPETCINHGK